MWNWQARIDELHHHLSAFYQIEDQEAIGILLAGLIDCPRTPAVWLILETNWYSRNCEESWFAFGGAWSPRSLGELRSMRPRRANDLIGEWRDEPVLSRLFVEPDWQQLPRSRGISEISMLVARSLRVRSMIPRTGRILAVDERERERRADQLAALTRTVIEDRIRARAQDPPVFREPANWLYRVELLQRLAPWYPDWTMLLNALATLAVRHAYLYNRSETEEDDWKIIRRVMHDSIPPWIGKAVESLSEEPADADSAKKLNFTALRCAMGINAADSPRGATAELYRLRQRGLIQWRPKKMEWAMVREHRAGMREIVRAPGVPAGSNP
jgi:hypothetical protein